MDNIMRFMLEIQKAESKSKSSTMALIHRLWNQLLLVTRKGEYVKIPERFSRRQQLLLRQPPSDLITRFSFAYFARQRLFIYVFLWNFAREIGARPAHARRLTAVFNYAVLPHLGAYLKFCSCWNFLSKCTPERMKIRFKNATSLSLILSFLSKHIDWSFKVTYIGRAGQQHQ